MQVFHIWPLVTERGGSCSLESQFAEAVSVAQLRQALPFGGGLLTPEALQKSKGSCFGAAVSSERLKQWQLFHSAGYAVYQRD